MFCVLGKVLVYFFDFLNIMFEYFFEDFGIRWDTLEYFGGILCGIPIQKCNTKGYYYYMNTFRIPFEYDHGIPMEYHL